jgi:hypothetical protein
VTNANCIVLPTSAGVKGRTLNAMTATILTISMADANNNNNKKRSRRDMYGMVHVWVGQNITPLTSS